MPKLRSGQGKRRLVAPASPCGSALRFRQAELCPGAAPQNGRSPKVSQVFCPEGPRPSAQLTSEPGSKVTCQATASPRGLESFSPVLVAAQLVAARPGSVG